MVFLGLPRLSFLCSPFSGCLLVLISDGVQGALVSYEFFVYLRPIRSKSAGIHFL